jgi:T3SS (YopN, CesT) and YbjN peptide-binding chaperone 1
MRTATLLRGHVERTLQEHWDRRELVVDDDGDYPWRAGRAMCWVRVEDDPPAVCVFAHAAHGVKRSARLLAEVNELNGSARWVKVFWHDGVVHVRRVLDLDACDPAAIRHACDCVGSVAEEIGPTLAAVFGGSLPLPAEVDHADDDR